MVVFWSDSGRVRSELPGYLKVCNYPGISKAYGEHLLLNNYVFLSTAHAHKYDCTLYNVQVTLISMNVPQKGCD